MAEKDYTDYVVMILDSGERLFHLYHIRNKKDLSLKAIAHNGHKYQFNMDRALRIKWAPWRKYNKQHPFRIFHELIRSKKIGLLLYQEPCTHKCSGCKLRVADQDACMKIPALTEPMHISRIHQPSGMMKG